MELRSGDFAGRSKCHRVPSCSTNKSHTDVTQCTLQLLCWHVGVSVAHSAVTRNTENLISCHAEQAENLFLFPSTPLLLPVTSEGKTLILMLL